MTTGSCEVIPKELFSGLARIWCPIWCTGCASRQMGDGMAERYTSAFVRKGRGGKGWRKCLKYKDEDAWKTISKKAEATGKRAAQKEAEDWRDEMNAQYNAEQQVKPTVIDGPDVTVAQYVRAYIKMRESDPRTPIEPETVYDYEKSLKDIENPDGGIANMRLTDVSYDDIEAWETWLLSADGKHFAVNTATKRHTLLKAALTQAVVDKRIQHNPMEGLRRPKKKKGNEINALMPDSMVRVGRWLESTEPTPFATAVAIAYCVGMRRQECAALKWEDVAFKYGFIRVRRAIGQTKNGFRVKDLKNHEARIVPITPPLQRFLTRRAAQMRSDLKAVRPGASIDNLYVCGEIDGTYGKMGMFTKQWKMLREILNLDGIWRKEVVFHDLRHSFATYTINSRELDLITVARVLGHKDSSVTLKWYSAALPTAILESAPKIARALSVENLDVPEYVLPGEV